MKITNVTAYLIDGEMYYRRGKPNGKKKEQLLSQIQKGEKPHKWGCIQEDKNIEKRRLFPKTGGCNSAAFKTQKENIGDLLSWLQTLEH